MPTDGSSLLLSSSPPSVMFNLSDSRCEDMGTGCRHCDDVDSMSDSGIMLSKRVHTYPPEQHHRFGHPLHFPFLASSLKVRSMSDSNQLATAMSFCNNSLSPEDVHRQKVALLKPLKELSLSTLRNSSSESSPVVEVSSTTRDQNYCSDNEHCEMECHYDAQAQTSDPHTDAESTYQGRCTTPVEKAPEFARDYNARFPHTLPKAITKSKGRLRHCVRFADDLGQPLFTIKVMKEPSDCPPHLDTALLRALCGDGAFEEPKPAASWQLNFEQPCSDYLKFRQSVEKNGVGLENVLIKNDQCKFTGTVKVKNLSFEKAVFIRYTENNWLSFLDKPAEYRKGRQGEQYDTFMFDVEIPCDDEHHEMISFCVCFKAGSQQDQVEYWDSNNGLNYSLVSAERKRRIEMRQLPGARLVRRRMSHEVDDPTDLPRTNDAWALDMGPKWGSFGAWKNLTTDGPYW